MLWSECEMKKVLVLGATGAMGTYLVPKLIERGYKVDAVTMDDVVSDTAGLKYFKENAIDEAVITERLKKGYDGIVDFMIIVGFISLSEVQVLIIPSTFSTAEQSKKFVLGS